jgi:hypothetical protein
MIVRVEKIDESPASRIRSHLNLIRRNVIPLLRMQQKPLPATAALRATPARHFGLFT